ncbi:MAG: hypothetical protein RBS30_09100, partial [Sphaerochaetaceae bacterium]|nr:hypothetical protein [Sphaerochaetaceae bacterium]
MRKRMLVLFLIVAVAIGSVFAGGGAEAAPAAAAAPVEKSQIILGSSTQLNGDFFDGWTNSATNAYLKELMGGYATVVWTKEGRYIINPIAIPSHTAVENADGTKTYTFNIAQNHTNNDGS